MVITLRTLCMNPVTDMNRRYACFELLLSKNDLTISNKQFDKTSLQL